MSIITLTSDFGTKDTYVGVMKGVILSISPSSNIIDLTHEIPAQNVAVGAWQISKAYSYFPSETIHLVVVDPGVGSDRRAVISLINNHTFVCPDNGLLSIISKESPMGNSVAIENDSYFLPHISNTFHGRDIFAPVAAYLAKGIPMSEFGPSVDNLHKINFSHINSDNSQIEGQIIWIDNFGNAVTNISQQSINQILPNLELQISFANQKIFGLCSAYNQAKIGEAIAIIGSSEHLEISVNQGSAQQLYGLSIGDFVSVNAL
ncbi:hypothetical protein CMK19_16030 [Candidatus Poribacteria bacterium]|jgi:S-adenosylmethionine hydrolase|nr:hypothetical protein [Candidatus Poribacteria bacterium]MEE2911148.1 SAM-dependent chlorinase/fluorinase [Candidatus Poribacteria bacterium]|tara:strand:+ start:175 stop:960 length:786 start_codon:yes stop_codon:yes gene_type:complete